MFRVSGFVLLDDVGGILGASLNIITNSDLDST